MILSFRDEETEKVFRGTGSRALPPNIQEAARRKLRYLESAGTLSDLRSPPGNRLEALKGTRLGQYSIRINTQWRVCFVWIGTGAEKVEIVDYH